MFMANVGGQSYNLMTFFFFWDARVPTPSIRIATSVADDLDRDDRGEFGWALLRDVISGRVV